MNRKGFTLVELIAVIALLAIIATISFVSINNVIEKSKVSDCENLILSIKSAAKECVSDHRYDNVDYIEEDCRSVSDLVRNKYLSGPVKDPFDNSNELESTSIDTNFNVKNSDNIEVNCTNNEW